MREARTLHVARYGRHEARYGRAEGDGGTYSKHALAWTDLREVRGEGNQCVIRSVPLHPTQGEGI